MISQIKKSNNSKHECLKVQGKGPGCNMCPVYKKGFCVNMIKIIQKMAVNLDKEFQKISLQDREEILSKAVTSILNGIDNFEGRNGARFSTWSWRIFLNNRVNYFRSAYRRKTITISELLPENNLSETIFNPSEQDSGLTAKVDEIIEHIKMSLPNDSSGCIRLFLDLFIVFKNGKSQRELSEDYGIKPNTLNQRIRRCRKIIRNIIENE